ncbi:type VI secretion system baseplate subunit TssF [Planctomicrobium sp.]|nr:type VI secretion system baseplate subunit TssF [Planctomicrobium sp.]MDB4742844.1 type VI secretion system baseplate subunit TssF [Planctomicrobium sp.]
MSDSIDVWYQRELEYLRSSGAEFANRYGKIADRLSLSASGTQDPHVERLLQGVAFLNARIRQKLDDSFPELVDSLLGVLYPHLIKPIPSTSVVQFQLNPQQADLVQGYEVARGTMLESDQVEGYGANYKTCFPLSLYPLEITEVELLAPPFQGPLGSASRDVESALHIRIKPVSSEFSMKDFTFEELRFFIDIGSFQHASKLMELLLSECQEIVVSHPDGLEQSQILSAKNIEQAGFEASEAILPFQPQSFPGYRLLTEHFVLPQKSLFFNLKGLTPNLLQRSGGELDLWIYMNEYDADLASLVKKDSLKLHCSPIVNLFQETADAIPVSINKTEYRIIPDARTEHLNEVYEIDNVIIGDGEDDEEEFFPFYSINHSSVDHPSYWHAVRRPGPQSRDTGPIEEPSEVYLRFVDENFRLLAENRGYLQSKVTCFNRLIPEALAKREISHIGFQIVGGSGPVSKINCLVAPTKTIRRHMGAKNLWPLVSQLSLNHLSLSGSEGTLALKEILKLNDPRGSTQAQKVISGILEVSSEPCVERIGGAFARGTQINLLLDQESFSGDSAYVFCSVLERFLSMYSSINSFTKLVATTNEDQDKGIAPWTWAPRTGNRPLV